MRNLLLRENIGNHCRSRITILPSIFSVDVSRFDDRENGKTVHTVSVTFMDDDIEILKCEYELNCEEEEILDTYDSHRRNTDFCEAIRKKVVDDLIFFIQHSGYVNELGAKSETLSFDLDKNFDKWTEYIRREIKRMGKLLRNKSTEAGIITFGRE